MGGFINSTAYNTKLNLFLCPSDGNAGRVNNNSYHASVGTTTNNIDRSPPGSSGVFGFQVSYGIADITDGTSNTVAYAEALCGRTRRPPSRSRANGTGNSGSSLAANLLDVNTAGLVALTTDLLACSNTFKTALLRR